MTAKKKVLGVDPLSWIKEKEKGKSIKIEDLVAGNDSKPQPKFENFDVKLTVRLNEAQLDYLSSLEREIMKSRSSRNKKERITKNSIIRSLINVFAQNEADLEKKEIADEKELENRIRKVLKF